MNQLMNTSQESSKSSAAGAGESRAMAEIQGAILMAKHDRRNEHQAYMAIMDTCKRHTFAEQALYAYPRGGKLVTGPSIRMAETMARHWKNLRVGVTITRQTETVTEARAYAFDMESNYMVDQEFTVPHKRSTKKGVQTLTDERDIRELVSNIGSRYLRGCILRLIPGDIVEDAVAQVGKTLQSSDVPISEQIKAVVSAFDSIGVKVEHLEKRLCHKLDAIIPQEIVDLRSIFKSIKDGMSKREDFFDIKSERAENALEEIKAAVSDKGKDK